MKKIFLILFIGFFMYSCSAIEEGSKRQIRYISKHHFNKRIEIRLDSIIKDKTGLPDYRGHIYYFVTDKGQVLDSWKPFRNPQRSKIGSTWIVWYDSTMMEEYIPALLLLKKK